MFTITHLLQASSWLAGIGSYHASERNLDWIRGGWSRPLSPLLSMYKPCCQNKCQLTSRIYAHWCGYSNFTCKL